MRSGMSVCVCACVCLLLCPSMVCLSHTSRLSGSSTRTETHRNTKLIQVLVNVSRVNVMAAGSRPASESLLLPVARSGFRRLCSLHRLLLSL